MIPWVDAGMWLALSCRLARLIISVSGGEVGRPSRKRLSFSEAVLP